MSPRRHAVFATLLLGACVLLPAAALGGDEPRRPVTWPARVMGTYAHVVIVTSDSAAAAAAAANALGVLHRVDSLMSNWTATSEVARINREAGAGTVTVEPEVACVLARSLRLFRESEGAFDVTVEPLVRLWGFLGGPKRVPAAAEVDAARALVGAQRVAFDSTTRALRFATPGVHVDLGGIAKGYAVAVAAESLRAAGITDALVDLTGNMAALGHPADAPRWRIGMRDPRDRMPYFARVELEPGEAISTSGKYEQFVAQDGRTWGHILDPRTGWPVDGLIAVTVVSRSAFECDAWDTPLFVLGPRDARRVARQHPEISAILVNPGTNGVDTVWVPRSLRARFHMEPQAGGLFHVSEY